MRKIIFEAATDALLTWQALVLCVLEEDFSELSATIIKIGPMQAWEAKGMDQFP